ncbi:MAG: transketolase C-terminal domain-containing protein [bacterium]|nr:transketolase C-terminal domain-containing protein [bacterium]
MPISQTAKLHPDVFDTKKLEQKPTRDGYGKGVVQAGKENPNVVVLCADLTESTRNTEFKKQFPDRFIQCGIHEQFLAAAGAGFALAGKIPFISSYAMFCPGRAWEQVRTNICLNSVGVKIAGAHAGVSVGPDGATHQAIEDIAILRPIPNMQIIVPCDAIETRKATLAAAQLPGPFYVRFGREKSPVFTSEETPFEFGKATVFHEGTDVAIIACGPLVYEALLAARQLESKKISVRVINSHTIKPLDEETILAAAIECGAIITVEEHQVIGGLGGAVCEYLSERNPVPVERIGIRDQFGQSGTPRELLEHYGLTAPHIVEAALRVLARKRT